MCKAILVQGISVYIQLLFQNISNSLRENSAKWWLQSVRSRAIVKTGGWRRNKYRVTKYDLKIAKLPIQMSTCFMVLHNRQWNLFEIAEILGIYKTWPLVFLLLSGCPIWNELLLSSEVPQIRFKGPDEAEEHMFCLTMSSCCQRNNNKKRRRSSRNSKIYMESKSWKKNSRKKICDERLGTFREVKFFFFRNLKITNISNHPKKNLKFAEIVELNPRNSKISCRA
jgi:hypothetical protein